MTARIVFVKCPVGPVSFDVIRYDEHTKEEVVVMSGDAPSEAEALSDLSELMQTIKNGFQNVEYK